MRIIPILIGVMALPLMALGQAADQQQGAAQGQTNEPQEKAPPKKKMAHATHEQVEPQARSTTHAETTKPANHANGAARTEARPPASKTHTKVNVQEFKSSHREVFTLGRHPQEFFVQRFGANHFRLIGNTYFVFVDGCWVAVDVAGFTFVERVICEGDPDFFVVY